MEATIYLLILIAGFIGIVVWVFGRKRKARFAKDARIPLTMGRVRLGKNDQTVDAAISAIRPMKPGQIQCWREVVHRLSKCLLLALSGQTTSSVGRLLSFQTRRAMSSLGT